MFRLRFCEIAEKIPRVEWMTCLAIHYQCGLILQVYSTKLSAVSLNLEARFPSLLLSPRKEHLLYGNVTKRIRRCNPLPVCLAKYDIKFRGLEPKQMSCQCVITFDLFMEIGNRYAHSFKSFIFRFRWRRSDATQESPHGRHVDGVQPRQESQQEGVEAQTR